jgi:hypothetical protein
MGIKQRIEKLEAGAPPLGDIQLAEAVLAAWDRVTHYPEEATDQDRAFLASNDWYLALCTLIDAAGGLEAVVLASIALQSRELGMAVRALSVAHL